MNAPERSPLEHSGRFGRLHDAMQRLVDDEILAGVSSAVLVGHRLVDLHCAGWADREARIALRPDHIFRVFSNTKLVTSCAALLLMEEGRFGLDDPIGDYLPQLAQLRVLKPGATRLDDTEPAHGPVRIRHLFSHSAGLGHGLMDPSRTSRPRPARASAWPAPSRCCPRPMIRPRLPGSSNGAASPARTGGFRRPTILRAS